MILKICLYIHRKDLFSAATLFYQCSTSEYCKLFSQDKCSVILRNRSTKLSNLPAFESCFAVTMLYTMVTYHLREDWFCHQTEKS